MVDTILKRDYSAIIAPKSLDYPDGFAMLSYFKSGFEANVYHVNDPEIDANLEKLSRELNQERRKILYRTIQLNILSKRTVVPLLFGSAGAGLWSPKIKRVPPHPIGLHMLPFESIEMK
jgi:ABC-type oligopeptide transport system substrate-binding subunit